jgi:hypothetical protein
MDLFDVQLTFSQVVVFEKNSKLKQKIQREPLDEAFSLQNIETHTAPGSAQFSGGTAEERAGSPGVTFTSGGDP